MKIFLRIIQSRVGLRNYGICLSCFWLLGFLGNIRADSLNTYALDMRFRQLMLDDWTVFQTYQVKKIYPQPQELGKPVLEATFPYEKELKLMQEPCVYYNPEEQLYRMWYWSTITDRRPQKNGKLTLLGYAESKDGLNWTKPILSNIEYQGDKKENNIVSDEFYTPVMLPIPKPGEYRFRFFNLHGRSALSRDGRKFDVIQTNELPAIPNSAAKKKMTGGGATADGHRFMFDPVTGKYLSAHKAWAPLAGSTVQTQWRRVIAMATSDDAVRWTFSDRLLGCDLADDAFVQNVSTRKRKDMPAWAEIEIMTLFRYEGLILGFPNFLHSYDGKACYFETSVHLWWSPDGENWFKPVERQPFLVQPVDTPYWGHAKGVGPLPPLRVGNELWIYHDVAEGQMNISYSAPRQQWITLSKLRLDGWAAYEAGADGGWLDTQRFVADGELTINADCSDGELRIEVFEVTSQFSHIDNLQKHTLLSGFTQAECVPVTGNQYEHVVKWKEKSWSDLKGKTVMLRIHLKNAKIYSFWTKEQKEVIGVQEVKKD